MAINADPRSDLVESDSAVRVWARPSRASSRLTRRLLSLVFVVSVVGAGVWAYSSLHGRAGASAYRLARVERGPLTSTVSATGALNAVITVQVGSQISGQIKQLLADFNSKVRRGDVVARIDPETFEAKVTQAQADVESAEASVQNQQAQVERYRADVQNARAAYAEPRRRRRKRRSPSSTPGAIWIGRRSSSPGSSSPRASSTPPRPRTTRPSPSSTRRALTRRRSRPPSSRRSPSSGSPRRRSRPRAPR